jgi:hypothetical protein
MKDNWPYLAGILDGEGCLHIAKFTAKNQWGKQYPETLRLDIHITTTCFKLTKWLNVNFGGTYYHIPMDKYSPKWKDAWRWQPSGKKNKERLLLGTLPYLIIKRELAEICLQFLKAHTEKRTVDCLELCQKARELSRRGRSVETNTSDSTLLVEKIESELISDNESASAVMLNA